MLFIHEREGRRKSVGKSGGVRDDGQGTRWIGTAAGRRIEKVIAYPSLIELEPAGCRRCDGFVDDVDRVEFPLLLGWAAQRRLPGLAVWTCTEGTYLAHVNEATVEACLS